MATPDVKDWKSLLSICRTERSEVEKVWDRLEKQVYENVVQLGDAKGRRIRVNLAFSAVKLFARACTAHRPFIYIYPMRAESSDGAFLLQQLENDLWRMQNRKKLLRRVVLEALLKKKGFGLVHLKSDWNGEQWPAFTPVMARDVWVDPVAESVDDAYFIIRRVLVPYQESIRRWKKFKDVLKPASRADLLGHDTAGKLKLSWDDYRFEVGSEVDAFSRVIVYEIHDQLNHQIAVMHEQADDFLEEPRENPYPFPTNWIELQFNERPGYFWGVSDLETVEGQQEEFDQVRTAMLKHVKRHAARKYALARGNVKKDSLGALEDDETGAIVQLDDVDGIKPIETAELPQSVLVYMDAIRGDYRDVTGLNEYQMAGRVPQTKTAYETEQIVAGATNRINEKPDLVSDFCEEIARRDIAIMKEFYDQPRVVRIAGPTGAFAWQNVTRWELQGEHEVEVMPGSTRPKDETSEFQRALMLWNQYAADPMVNHQALLQICMRMQNILERDRLLNIMPSPEMGDGTPGGTSGNPENPGIPDAQVMARMLRSPRIGM